MWANRYDRSIDVHQCVTNHWCRPTENNQRLPSPNIALHAPLPLRSLQGTSCSKREKEIALCKGGALLSHTVLLRRGCYVFVMSPFLMKLLLFGHKFKYWSKPNVHLLLQPKFDIQIILLLSLKDCLNIFIWREKACKCFLNEEKTWIKKIKNSGWEPIHKK